MSSCEGPPTMNSTMLCFAFGGKFGNFGAAAALVRRRGGARLLVRQHAGEAERAQAARRDAIQSRRENRCTVLGIMARK